MIIKINIDVRYDFTRSVYYNTDHIVRIIPMYSGHKADPKFLNLGFRIYDTLESPEYSMSFETTDSNKYDLEKTIIAFKAEFETMMKEIAYYTKHGNYNIVEYNFKKILLPVKSPEVEDVDFENDAVNKEKIQGQINLIKTTLSQ